MNVEAKIETPCESPDLKDPVSHPIPKRRQVKSNFFWTWSLKAGGRLVGLESELEFRAFHYLSAKRNVCEIAEQPVQIPHLFSAGHRYTFDVGTRLSNGEECLFEIKPDSQLEMLADGSFAPRYWEEIKTWCKAAGRNCDFLTDRDLDPHALLIDNWITMMPYVREAHEYPELEILAELVQLSTNPEGVTLANAAAAIESASTQTVVAQAAWLIHEGELSADLDNELFDGDLVVRTGGVDE